MKIPWPRLDSQSWSILAFSLLVIYLTLFFQLGNLPFVGADEPRYARVGEEMLLRGDFVTPTLDFEPWLEKPPLLFWLEAASFAVFGVSEASARLPVALMAFFTVLICAFAARRLAGNRCAVLTVLILPTSGLFFAFGRAASTDMPMTACLTAAIALGAEGARRGRAIWGASAGAALGLAILAKGPVALLLFAMIFGAYCLLLQRFIWTLPQVALAVATMAAVATPWFWLIWNEHAYDFVATFWINHHLARFLTTVHHHEQPFWYYGAILLLGFFPWVFFLGSGLKRLWRFRRWLNPDKLPWEPLLWLWALLPILFFSLSGSKLPGYILPSVPPLALLAAREWDRFLGGDLTAFRAMKIEQAILSAFGLALSAALIFGPLVRYGSWKAGLWVALPLLASVLWGRFEYVRHRPAQLFLSLAAGMTLVAALAYWQVAPIVGSFHTTRDIARRAIPLVSKEKPLIIYIYFHHSARYYSGYLTTKEAVPTIEKLREYMDSHAQDRYYILTQKDGWGRLQDAFEPKLIMQQGDFYLVEIDS